jgi:hypothetical protein
MSRSDLPKVRLVASAESGTDIWVIDGKLRTVAHDARRLEADLAPGLYKVRFQTGSAVSEQMVELVSTGAPVEISAPQLQFMSTVPLNRTELIHEYHRDNAVQTSRQVHVHAGGGSRVFVFSRSFRDRDRGRRASPPPGQHPAEGLSLLDLQGHVVAPLAQAGVGDLGVPDPWSACSVELNPGPYRLRLDVPGLASLEQLVVASPGWQTQVFLLLDDYGEPSSPTFRADLETAAILMAREHDGFNPDDEMLRLTELARNALARERVKVAKDLLGQLLDWKFENPMLGLYAGHAILAAPRPDRDLLSRVVGRLRGIIGTHPDLDAIALWLGEKVTQPYAVPPMFRRSWNIVVDRAMSDRLVVPSGSMASGIAGNVWGEGVWLIWDAEAARRTAAEPVASAVDIARIGALGAQRVSSEGVLETHEDLDDVDLAILSYTARRSRSRTATPVTESPTSATPEDDIAQVLNLPPSTVEQKVSGLVRKLEAPEPPRATPEENVEAGAAPPQTRRYEVSL